MNVNLSNYEIGLIVNSIYSKYDSSSEEVIFADSLKELVYKEFVSNGKENLFHEWEKSLCIDSK